MVWEAENDQNAREILRHLSGQRHQVYTGVAVWDPARGWGSTSIAVAHVTFRPLSALEIADYVQSGEPLDKAGAYAIQGRAGQWVVALRESGNGHRIAFGRLAKVAQL